MDHREACVRCEVGVGEIDDIMEPDFEINATNERDIKRMLKNTYKEAKEMTNNPGAWLDRVTGENEMTGIIFFRGQWCPLDAIFMRRWDDLHRTVMSKSGCKLYGVCSQTQTKVEEAIRAWGLSSFDAIIGDHENKFTSYVRDNVDLLPELFICDCSKIYHPYLQSKNYPNGATQPAIFFFVGKKPVLGWCKQPTLSDLYGGLERPNATEAWKEVVQMKKYVEQGKPVPISNGGEIPVSITCKEVFCSIL